MSVNLRCKEVELWQTPTHITYMCYYKFITPIIAYKITCPKCGGEEIPTHIKDRKSARAWVSGMAFHCNGEGNVLHHKGD